MENKLNDRMSVPSTNRRKSSDANCLEKTKFTAKHNEMKSGTHDKSEVHENMDTIKKSDNPILTSSNRKSDTEKPLHADGHDKASTEPYVHEFKEFAGVTIILRSATNPKGFASSDAHGKAGTNISRRKSEFQHSQFNAQDKFEHGDKTDHAGTSFPVYAAKPDTSTNNSNDTSRTDSQH